MKLLSIFLAIMFILLCPIASAQWVQTSLDSCMVRCFALSGTNLIAGTGDWDTWGGGVFLSTDDGSSWTAVNNGLMNTYVAALVASGTNLFAGCDGGYSDKAGGVFRSTNNGASWTAASVGLTNTHVLALAISGTNLFAGTDSGAFLSKDNGTSWTAASTGLRLNSSVNALAVSGTNLFAGTDGGIFLSTDNGASWTPVNNGLPNTWVLSLAISGTNLFAGTWNGVFLSTDNGANWSAVNTGLTNICVNALAVSGQMLFASTGEKVFLSMDNGTRWTSINNGLTGTYVFSLAVSGTNIFAGTYSGGVLRRPLWEMTAVWANAKLGWYQQNSGTMRNLRAVSFTDANHGTVVGDSGTILRTTNGGTAWTSQTSGTTQSLHGVCFTDLNTGTIVGDSGTILRTTNGGAFWTTQTSGTMKPLRGIAFPQAIAGIAVGDSGTVLRTSNGGTSWMNVASGDTSDLNAVSTVGPNIAVAVGGYPGSIYLQSYATILRTSDGGFTWSIQRIDTVGSLGALSFADANIGITFDSWNVLRTSDGGITWNKVSNMPPTAGGWGTGIFLVDSSTGFATCYNLQHDEMSTWWWSTIFQTTDAGCSWLMQALGRGGAGNRKLGDSGGGLKVGGWRVTAQLLAEDSVQTINASRLNGIFFSDAHTGTVVGDGGTIYRTVTGGVVGVHHVTADIPKRFLLLQNYPNPFNPSTTIRYSLPQRSHVTLTVFNILGQQVATLVNETRNAGVHEAEFDGAGLSSGLYFYRLQAGDFIQTKKFLIVK
jgi:photosystem II stability/assembly factor-like uncharacterized protein